MFLVCIEMSLSIADLDSSAACSMFATWQQRKPCHQCSGGVIRLTPQIVRGVAGKFLLVLRRFADA